MDNLKIGDKVVYSSAAGLHKPAVVKNIDLARNGTGDLIPWVTLEMDNPNYRISPNAPEKMTARFAAIESYLKIMKVRKVED